MITPTKPAWPNGQHACLACLWTRVQIPLETLSPVLKSNQWQAWMYCLQWWMNSHSRLDKLFATTWTHCHKDIKILNKWSLDKADVDASYSD